MPATSRPTGARTRRLAAVTAAAAVVLAGVPSSAVARAHHHPHGPSHGSSHGHGHPHQPSPQEQAVAAAKAEYASYHKTQAPLAIPVLPARPPAGKTMVISTCAVAVCHLSTDPAVTAASMLGWTVKQVELPLSGPQPLIDLWQSVIADPPDLMVYYGYLPISTVQTYVDQAAALGVKIVDIAPKGTVVSASGPVRAEVNGPGVLRLSGQLMADAVVKDACRGKARTVWVTDPTRSFFLPAQTAFTDVITKTGGSVDTLSVALANIGTTIPGQVVDYVRTHPDVEYLAFALNDLTAGVPAALKAAHLDKRVKIIARAPTPAAVADIQHGDQWAAVTEEVETAGWRNIDQLARLAEGVAIPSDLVDPVGWHMIVDRSNIGTNPAGPAVPGFPDAFLKAWHLS
jgi:ribose transport system substrate-binding protein